jgi:hypothetical protein
VGRLEERRYGAASVRCAPAHPSVGAASTQGVAGPALVAYETYLSEPRCQCGRTKTIVRYIESPRARLALGKKRLRIAQRTVPESEPFVEPYPDGKPTTLLACNDCDEVASWPRTTPKKKSRFKP